MIITDLVVAAPFEGRGAVYIYHGGPNGLSKTPSQTINAPNDTGSEMLMFGHGLSKGFDIDKNGVPDLAVGAPNVDTVYVFKGYPVAIVTASITTTPEKLEQVQSQFTIKACWKLDTNATLKENSSNVFSIVFKYYYLKLVHRWDYIHSMFGIFYFFRLLSFCTAA